MNIVGLLLHACYLSIEKTVDTIAIAGSAILRNVIPSRCFRKRFIEGLILSAWLVLPYQAFASNLQASGYIKNFSVIQDQFELTSDKNYSTQFTGRMMLDVINPNSAFQLHYEISSQFNSRRGLTSFSGTQTDNESLYRLTDVKTQLSSDQGKTVTLQNLDRLNFQLSLDAGDITVGRQAITFGSARIINPTDVFLPFNVQALNTEYRVGVDAIRFQKPIGQLSELDFGYVFGENQDRSAIFLRAKTNVVGNDIEITAMEFSNQSLFGVGIESTLGPFGTWFEFAHVNGDDTYNRASFGIDYGFSENWFGMLELHYNGAGAQRSNLYLSQLNQPAYQVGGVFLLGQQYLIPSLSWQLSAVTSASIQFIANLDDQSTFLSVGIDRSLSDNLYLGAQVYWFGGDDLTLAQPNSAFPINLHSEYGANPAQFILNLRYYF